MNVYYSSDNEQYTEVYRTRQWKVSEMLHKTSDKMLLVTINRESDEKLL